jgi:hypothetical protein
MSEMVRFGDGASLEVGVSGEGDAMLGGEESPGARREASRWSSVETALNRMVSVSWQTHGSSFLNWTRGCSWVTLSLTSLGMLSWAHVRSSVALKQFYYM